MEELFARSVLSVWSVREELPASNRKEIDVCIAYINLGVCCGPSVVSVLYRGFTVYGRWRRVSRRTSVCPEDEGSFVL